MTVNQLSIGSWNVRSLGQGLQGTRKRSEIKSFLTRQVPQCEIILLQEHCFSMEDCLDSTQQLHFRGGCSFWNNALYTATGDKYHAGTALLLSKTFKDRITGKGAPVEGRAQFVTLVVNKQSIGILNIYAPNDTGARARFWSKLADYPFPKAE